MASKIKIAVDAMGGENSPKKVIDGILENHKENKDVIYNIFGDKEKKNFYQKIIIKKFLILFNTKNKILDTDLLYLLQKKVKIQVCG